MKVICISKGLGVNTTLTKALLILFLAFNIQFYSKEVKGQAVLRLSLPESNWGLDISLAGFTVMSESISSDGRNYALDAVIRRRPDGEVDDFSMFEIRMAPAQSQGDGQRAREFAIEMLKQNKSANGARDLRGNIRTFDYNQIPISRYVSTNTLAANLPLKIPQESIEAYFAKNGVWIVIAFTSSKIDNYEQKLFNAALDSVRIVDTAAKPSSSLDFYHRGRALFLQKKYAVAIESYSAALQIEQKEPTLGVTAWRQLIEDLTVSNAVIGNVAQSMKVLDYGISKDPAFPMFYLGQARWYASRDDLDNTIASLQRAFNCKENYKDTNGQVRPLPNPMYDPSFERFKKVEKFRKAVKTMMK